MLAAGENFGRHTANLSARFQHGFVRLLSSKYVHPIMPDAASSFGAKLIKANPVYQKFDQDRHHQHTMFEDQGRCRGR
jgi:DNA/RNA-binding protein KIN17